MFSASKPLIGSPVDNRRSFNEMEFTPIGHNSNASRKSALRAGPPVLQQRAANLMNNSPLKHRFNGGSSFLDESEYDIIHNSPVKASQVQDRELSPPLQNSFARHDLLENGSNPVRQQQDNIKKLQDENYNLKLKLASLTRFVNSITNDEQHEIYKQNSELQEKLIEMRGEYQSMTKELKGLRNKRDEKNAHSFSQFDEDHYKHEIRKLNCLVSELKDQLDHNESDYEEKKQALENNIEALQHELQELEAQSNVSSSHAIHHSFVANLERRAEQMVDALEDKDVLLRQRENQIEQLQDDLEDNGRNLRQKEDQITALHEKIKNLEALVQELRKKPEEKSERAQFFENRDNHFNYIMKEKDDRIEKLSEVINAKNLKLSDIKSDLLEAQSIIKREMTEKKDLQSLADSCQQKLTFLENELIQMKQTGSDSRHELRQSEQYQIDLELELKRLKSKVDESKSIIIDQKRLIQELQSEASSNNQLDESNQELFVKLERLQRDIHNVSLERDSLKRQLQQTDNEILTLRNNNDRAHQACKELEAKLKNPVNAQVDVKAYQRDMDQLASKIEELNFENEKLHKSLEKEKLMKKTFSDTYDKMELKSLASKCNELQIELNDKENEMLRKTKNLDKELDQYKTMLRNKEEDLLKLKSKIQFNELNYTEKFSEEKLELLKAKRACDNQIKILQLELESSEEQHKAEVNLLKTTIERLRKAPEGVDRLSQSSLSVDHDLLAKLNHKNSRLEYLTSRLEKSTQKIKSYEKLLLSLEEEKQFLSMDNKKIESQLGLYEEKLREYKASILKLTEANTAGVGLESYKMELKLKERELELANKDFNAMKHALIAKYKSTVDEKKFIEGKFEKLATKYRTLQNTTSINANQRKKITYLQDQNDLFRMKYTKSLYNIQDLKFVNSFMVKSIQAANKHIKKDIKKLQDVGIYPDYELIRQKKPSLRVILKFVVAAVRIKRKSEYSATKNKKIEVLGTKLELIDY